MRIRVLLIALIALVLMESASAAPGGKPGQVRVVRREGAFSATLTYSRQHGGYRSTVVVRRNGQPLLSRRASAFPIPPSLAIHRVSTAPVKWAVVLDIPEGGMSLKSAIAVLTRHPHWVVREWGRSLYRGRQLHGRYYFASGDNRFWCVFASCATTWVPPRIWAIGEAGLVDVTTALPALVRADDRRAWRWYLAHGRRNRSDRGIGILAGWCADEYTLRRGEHCQRVLAHLLAAGVLKAPGFRSARNFIDTLTRDLERWGYKSSRKSVKRVGAFTATLTYSDHPKRWLSPISGVRLKIEHDGRTVFERKLCQPHMLAAYRCRSWDAYGPALSVGRVGPRDAPTFLVSLWTGGNTCCEAAFIAIPGPKVVWITHTFSFMGARMMRRHHRSFFVGSDGRFYCAFSVCAGAATPIQIWTIDAANRFVDVTRSFPALIRKQARSLATGGAHGRMTIRDQGTGILAPWCADEYLLGQEARCSRVLAYAMKRHWPKKMQGAIPGRGFARSLKHQLVLWGYTRSASR